MFSSFSRIHRGKEIFHPKSISTTRLQVISLPGESRLTTIGEIVRNSYALFSIGAPTLLPHSVQEPS